MRLLSNFLSPRLVCGLIFLCAFTALPARGQEPGSPSAKQVPKSPEASEKAPELPAQIELLETRVRFETNGDSRKEVHTRVHINNELGARQFARLAFDYNRSFQQIDFPLNDLGEIVEELRGRAVHLRIEISHVQVLARQHRGRRRPQQKKVAAIHRRDLRGMA